MKRAVSGVLPCEGMISQIERNWRDIFFSLSYEVSEAKDTHRFGERWCVFYERLTGFEGKNHIDI